MANWLKRLKLNAIALVDRGANPEARVVLAKRDQTQKAEHEYASMEECMAAGKSHEECQAMMAAIKRAKGEDMPDPLPEDVTKALAEVADLKKQVAEFEAIKKRAADAEAEVKKMQEAEATRAAISKATALSYLPGNKPEEFGPILRKMLGALTPEESAKAEQLLTAANNTIATSQLLDEVGKGGVGVAKEPYEKLEALASTIQKSEKGADGKALTFEQAFAKACDRNPEAAKIYDEYEKERQATARRVR